MTQPRRRALASAVLLAWLAPPTAYAQRSAAGGAVPSATAAPREAAQFDFLIGQWEVDLTPKVSGLVSMIHGAPKLTGLWKAWKSLDGFGVEDELRVVDASANPMSLSHSVRVWDSRNKRWAVQGLDVYRARFSVSQGQWQDGEMRLTGTGNSPAGKPVLTRTRFFDITPASFRMRQDRSADDGATWEEGVLNIVARRTAAKAAR